MLAPGADGVAGLTCADGDAVVDYIEMVAARPVPSHQGTRVFAAIAGSHRTNPTRTASQVAGAKRYVELLRSSHGPEAGPLRSNTVYDALNGAGPFHADDGMPYSVLKASVAPWATHSADRLVLTEMDVEGWIKYASLCREVQGGGPLVLSLGDRQGAYNILTERFHSGTEADRRALVSMGPFWQAIRDRWKSAPYEDQQRWIGGAPLPPPMTGSNLDYVRAVVSGDLVQHVAFMHYSLGPFVLFVP